MSFFVRCKACALVAPTASCRECGNIGNVKLTAEALARRIYSERAVALARLEIAHDARHWSQLTPAEKRAYTLTASKVLEWLEGRE